LNYRSKQVTSFPVQIYHYSIFSTKSKEKSGDFPKYGKLFFIPIYQKTPNFFGVFFVLLFID
jgi:hypothetical protein